MLVAVHAYTYAHAYTLVHTHPCVHLAKSALHCYTDHATVGQAFDSHTVTGYTDCLTLLAALHSFSTTHTHARTHARTHTHTHIHTHTHTLKEGINDMDHLFLSTSPFLAVRANRNIYIVEAATCVKEYTQVH